MEKLFVETHDGGYWVSGTRVSLDSIVYAFRQGYAPETIRRSFPVLTLEEVYGAITFYLGHETEIDDYMKEAKEAGDLMALDLNAKARAERPGLFERLRKARETVRQ
jgi:uncharacterized protein (DUF433 family)